MSLSLTLTPGYLFQDNDILTPAILRLIAQPSVLLEGGIGTATLADGSVTTAKLADGALSADALGQGKMAAGYFQANLTSRQQFAGGFFDSSSAGRAPFGNGFLTLAMIASGIFTNTPAGRAPFGNGLMTAALMQPDAYWYGTGSGTGLAYVVTFNPTLASYLNGGGGQAYTNYWDGLIVAFKAPATNLVNVTLAESSLAIAKTIYRNDGTALQAGDIISGSIVECRYNSTLASGAGGWQLMSDPATPLIPFYRAGTFTATTTPSTVTFSSAVPNTNYRVAIAATSGGTQVNQCLITSKTTAGFTVQIQINGPTTYDYIVLPTL